MKISIQSTLRYTDMKEGMNNVSELKNYKLYVRRATLKLVKIFNAIFFQNLVHNAYILIGTWGRNP